MSLSAARIAAHRVALKEIAPPYPRFGEITGILPLIKGGHALTYLCSGKSYVAYLNPGDEEHLRIGQQVEVHWGRGEQFAKIMQLEAVAAAE